MTAQFDMLLRNSRLNDASCNIGVRDGRIAAIGQDIGRAACTHDLDGRVVIPGLVETHKAGLLCRCGQAGGLAGAVAAVSADKRDFTVQDVYERAARVIRAAITQGTMHMRTHVEVDPRAGMRSFQAMLVLKREFAFCAGPVDLCFRTGRPD